jgi:Flp pilus assembly protein TadD
MLAACGGEQPRTEAAQVGGSDDTVRLTATTPPLSAPVAPQVDAASQTVTFADAELVYRSGNHVEAARLFEAYTVRRPENAWGHYMHGIAAWKAGDHARAETALRKSIELDPKHTKGLINLTRVLLEQRKASDAIEYAEQVVALDPELGEGWRVLGNARAELNLVDAATDAYRQAIVLDAEDAWTMNNLGLLRIDSGEYRAALAPLARAVELRPKTAIFQNNLGIALERAGHTAESAEAYRAALATDEAYEKARVSLARVEAKGGSGTTAIEVPTLAAAFAEQVRTWQVESVATEPAQPSADSIRTPGVGN